MTDYLFKLPDSDGSTLQARIQAMMVAAILNRHVQPGSPLPSGRKLAGQLKVARNTVVLAYQALVDEGFIESRERSGFYVREDVLAGHASAQAAGTAPSESKDQGEKKADWQARLVRQPSRFRHIKRPEDWRRFEYPFIYGQYDQAMFPIAGWRDCCRDAASVAAIHEWAADRIDQDNPALIEQIHQKLLPRRGIFVDREQILVTLGAQQAIYLTAQLLLDASKTAGVENPGYTDTRNTFHLHTDQLKCLPVDNEGLIVDHELDDCDLVYVTPSHQYPTTVTLSAKRRAALLQKAQAANFIILEDDYESELNYGGAPMPALKSEDRDERVVYVGSISKTLAPGIRLGYMVAPQAMIDEARVLRRLMLRHPPSNNQFIIARFLQRGYHDALIRKLGNTLHRRSEILRQALDRLMPGAASASLYGGSSFWVKAPDDIDAHTLAKTLKEKGVIIEPGNPFFYPKPENCRYFRLGLGSIPDEKIEAGIDIIAATIGYQTPSSVSPG